MQAYRLAAATFAITGTFGVAATASESLPRPAARSSEWSTAARDAFKPENALRAIAERLGYHAKRFSTGQPRHDVLAAHRNGRNFEIKFSGADLRMISRYEARDEHLSAFLP